MTDTFDLSAYLARVGSPRVDGADLATLARLHRAHITAIPFENLDIQMGRSIAIDAASLQAGLVSRRRGGYCFQQNGLFRLALSALGFRPQPREARVRFGATIPVAPRTHMVLVVPVDGVDWLVDVGFGAVGIVEPVPVDTPPTVQDGWTYRMIREGRLHLLQRARQDTWDDLYAFADDEVPDIDYIVGNWFTSTHPDSKFVRSLTAQRMVGDARHVVRDLTYGVAKSGGEFEIRDLTRSELVPLLHEVFALDIPDDARFRALDEESPTVGAGCR